MGMNYYCKLGTKMVTCEYGHRHRVPDIIHIGKSSYGWAFILQGYDDDKHHITSLDEWKKTLQNSILIFDEENCRYTYDDMMKTILKPGIELTEEELKQLQAEALEMSIKESWRNAKYVVKNGLLNDQELLSQSGAKDDENFVIDYRDFS